MLLVIPRHPNTILGISIILLQLMYLSSLNSTRSAITFDQSSNFPPVQQTFRFIAFIHH